MSPKSAGLAVKMGYTNVKVYLQGNPGWEESGHILVASDAFVLDGNIILVDLRDPKAASKVHIPRAVNIPLASLEDASDQFPRFAGAPIVLYGAPEDVARGVETIKGWGYRTVSAVAGGIERWRADGRPVNRGAPATLIVWERKIGEGEVTLAEFQKVISERPQDKVILDVRGPEEVAEGQIAGAMHIPLDQLETRMGELPPGKEVLIHCTTGARAEMARAALVKAGIPSRFCMAQIECSEGECSLQE